MRRLITIIVVYFIAAVAPSYAQFLPAFINFAASGGHGSAVTVFSVTPSGDNAGNNGFTVRVLTGTIGTGGTQVRCTWSAGTGGTMSSPRASVGISSGVNTNTVSTPVETLFGGGSGFAPIPASGSVTSDWTNLTSLTTDKIICLLYINTVGGVGDGHMAIQAGSSTGSIEVAGDQTANATGGATGATYYALTKVEVRQ